VSNNGWNLSFYSEKYIEKLIAKQNSLTLLDLEDLIVKIRGLELEVSRLRFFFILPHKGP